MSLNKVMNTKSMMDIVHKMVLELHARGLTKTWSSYDYEEAYKVISDILVLDVLCGMKDNETD